MTLVYIGTFRGIDFNYSLHLLDSCLLHFLPSDGKAITLQKGVTTHTKVSKLITKRN